MIVRTRHVSLVFPLLFLERPTLTSLKYGHLREPMESAKAIVEPSQAFASPLLLELPVQPLHSRDLCFRSLELHNPNSFVQVHHSNRSLSLPTLAFLTDPTPPSPSCVESNETKSNLLDIYVSYISIGMQLGWNYSVWIRQPIEYWRWGIIPRRRI